MPRESAAAKRKREAPVTQKPLPVHEWRQVHRDEPPAKRAADAGKQLPEPRKEKARGGGRTVDEVGGGDDVPLTTRAFPAGLQLPAPPQRRVAARRSPPADPQAAAPAQDAPPKPPKAAKTMKEASPNPPQQPALLSSESESEKAPSAEPPQPLADLVPAVSGEPSPVTIAPAPLAPAPLAPEMAAAARPPVAPAAKGGSRGQGLLLAAQTAQQQAGALGGGAQEDGAGASSAVDDANDFLAIEGIRVMSAVERAKANTRTLARRIPQRAPLPPRAPPTIPHHREAPPGLLAPPLRHPASWGGARAAAAAGGLQAGVMSRKVPEYSEIELVSLLPMRYARCNAEP
ncbi:hypothetical protein T484DRAFT_1804780 [Baffinella frigidus]|nr:hypothetical protein T484DRAFT_1804780 [Cryptophyta sp. CCMP2293]